MTTPCNPILFSCNWHAGQINPMLAIAAELSRRNVPDLWFAANSNRRADIESASTGTPINFIPIDLPGSDRTDVLVRATMNAARDSYMKTTGIVAFCRLCFNLTRTVGEYQKMLKIIETVQPSRMIVDILTFPSLDAAMTTGTPFTITIPSLPSSALRVPSDYPGPMTDLPRRMSVPQAASSLLFKIRCSLAVLTRTPAVMFTKKRKAMGIKNPGASPATYADAAELVLISSIFGLEYEFPVPAQVHLIGAFVPDNTATGEDSELSQWLDNNSSVVYMGFGTLMSLSRSQIAALLNAIERLGPDHKFLWKLPKLQQELLPTRSDLPGNLRIENWIPSQLDVLAHQNVRVFVTHGGSNGFHESIYYGTPVLVMPAWLDCYAIARRAVDSGVGLAIRRPASVTGEEMTATLTRLLTEDTFHERAEYWSGLVREAGGVARAAGLIMKLHAACRGGAHGTPGGQITGVAGAGTSETWAETIRQPSGKRTQTCVWRPSMGRSG